MIYRAGSPATDLWASPHPVTHVNVGRFGAWIEGAQLDASTQVSWRVDGTWTPSSSRGVRGGVTRHALELALPTGCHTVTAWVVDTSDRVRIGGWSARPSWSRTWSFFQQ